MSPSTSASLVSTRPDVQRPALHKCGATDGCVIDGSQIDRVLDLAVAFRPVRDSLFLTDRDESENAEPKSAS